MSKFNPRGSRQWEASAAASMTDDSDGPSQINRDDPAAVLIAYDQIIAKNKSLSAEVEEGEKALGKQLKEITKMKQDNALSKELYDTSIKERDRLKAELDTSKAAETTAQADNVRLRETLSTLETKMSDVEAKAKAAPPQAKSDDPTTLKLVDANKELTKQLDDKNKQLDDAVVEKQKFETTIDKLNEKVKRYSQTSTKLSKDLDEWKSKHHDLEGKVEGLEEQNRLIAQRGAEEMTSVQQVIKANKGILMSIQDKAKNALDLIKSQAEGKTIQAAPSPKPKILPPRRVEPKPSSGGDAGDARSYPSRDASDLSPSSMASSRTPARGHSAPETRGLRRSRSPRRPRSRSLDRPGQRKSSSTAVPPQSIAARKESSKQQDKVPFSFRTPTTHNGPGNGTQATGYSQARDPCRRPAFCYASMAKPATGDGKDWQGYKAPNRGHAHFIWRTTQQDDARKDQLGQWRKGRPRYEDFARRNSGLYPSMPQDIADYGDGGWRAGESGECPEYRKTGPTSQQRRLESHGRIFSFRQPFTHRSSERMEKNDWWVSRRENRPTFSSHGVSGEDSVSSCPDSRDGGSLSPRMRDSIIARYDDSRIEESIRGTIDLKELRTARDGWGNQIAFHPAGLQGNA